MKRLTSVAICGFLVTTLGVLGACGNRAKMETCKFVEIEDAEVEVEFGDVDAERGEVEMMCGNQIIDIPWSQFRTRLQIDPGQYKSNLEEFKRQVSCMKDEREDLEVFCNRPGSSDEFAALTFSFDD